MSASQHGDDAAAAVGDPKLTDRQAELKRLFIESRGYWAPFWDGLLMLDTDFFEIFLDFSAHPWRNGRLEPKVKELIYIAIDSSTTHLYEPGLRVHIRNALGHGATREEIMEVYELVSVLGMHTITMGVPVLLDELDDAREGLASSLSPRQAELKDRFIEARGYWADFWDGLLALDPDFFEIFLNFSTHPWNRGHLEPKVRELIYIAIDAATTHLWEPGLRVHIQNALGHGATREEIMEVYELVSVLGMHTITLGVPVLLDELAKTRSPSRPQSL